ncbi:MAG: oligoendopeptidase F [Bacteroidales bacterium]|nr:oligoendopeptidase F [Bacteroidales bacterium]
MKNFRFLTKILLAFMLMLSVYGFSQDKQIPDYSLKDRKDVPVEFTWKLEDLYLTLDAWKADKDEAKKLMEKVDEYSKDWTSSPQKMFALLDLTDIINLKAEKLYAYMLQLNDADMENAVYQDLKGELQAMYVQFNSKLAFLNADIIKLGKEKFDSYLKTEPKLKPYDFWMYDILRSKDHVLPQEQQNIVSLTSLFSQGPGSAASMMNDVEIPFPEVTMSDGQKVTLNLTGYLKWRKSKVPDDRRLAWNTFWGNEKKFEKTIAILLNTSTQKHFFNTQVYKFPDCLSARLFDDNIDTSVYYQLLRSVHENLAPLHRYLELKKKMLGLDKFMYQDIYVSTVKNVEKKYTYEEAQKMIIEAMKPLGTEYTDVLKTAVANRWIDVYTNKGKQSGAYSRGVYGVHPYIKLNYDGEYYDVGTFAHELGHTVHSYYSNKTQHFEKSNYPVFLAEIASTFNEEMLLDYVLKNEKDDLFKLFILNSYIEDARNSLYRQTMYAEFELAIHKRVEEGKTLTSDWMNNKYLELANEYYGKSKGIIEIPDLVSTEWTRVPHLYYNFYVYQYSTGLISSMALCDMVLKGGENEKNKYLDLLRAGGSDYAIPLLKNAGVDMTKKDAFNAAFKRFDYLVGEMEKIYEKLKAENKL